MKKFRERDPVRVGAVGGLLLVAIALITFYHKELPAIGGGRTYAAQFSEAAGLKRGDEVRVAGVKVGEVTSVELERDHVLVGFRARDVWLGDQTVAAIKIKTLLGQRNLVLDPLGTKDLDPSTPIPRERTVTPYDVNDAFGDLANTATAINTDQLAEGFRALSATFTAYSPDELRRTLDGLTALSRTISSRDQQLTQLLDNTARFAGTIAERTDAIEALISDGGVLLEEIRKRRDAIAALLDGTKSLSSQLSALVKDNQAQLGPALEQLDRVTAVLQRNQANLDRGLRLAGPFYRLVGNAVGNGPWLDTYLCGLVPATGGGCAPPRPGGGR